MEEQRQRQDTSGKPEEDKEGTTPATTTPASAASTVPVQDSLLMNAMYPGVCLVTFIKFSI